jgi:hypothetical protein
MRQQHPPSVRRARSDADDAIRTITRMIVSFGRQGGEEDDRIRKDVEDAIKEVLHGSKEWKAMIDLDDGGPPQEMVTHAGLYRAVFERHGLDRSDLHKQERWHRIVMDELEATLLRNDGDFRRRDRIPG